MTEPFVIELEPEVRLWLEILLPRHYRQAEEKAELLASSPTIFGEPHSRNLGEGVRELRFILDGNAVRVTYWLAPNLDNRPSYGLQEDADAGRGRGQAR